MEYLLHRYDKCETVMTYSEWKQLFFQQKAEDIAFQFLGYIGKKLLAVLVYSIPLLLMGFMFFHWLFFGY